MNLVIYILSLVFILHSWTWAEERTFVLTMPKSGTHLLEKLMLMILEKDLNALYYTNIDQEPFKQPVIPDEQFFIFNHVYPGFDVYRTDGSSIKVLLIRDLRDAVVSFMHWLPKCGNWGPWTPKEVIEKFNALPENERLKESILWPDQYLGIALFCKKAVEWMQDPSVFVCRFEELAGPQAGGSRTVQEETIDALSQHLGYPLSREKIVAIADKLFGNEDAALISASTFREGKIGSWRRYFTEEHKALFKEVMGQELIDMGYETDFNW